MTERYFLHDGDDEVVEYDGGKHVVALYVPGPAIDEPIAMVTPSGSSYTHEYFHANHQGSVIAMSGDSGALAEGPFTYDPYGNCFAGSSACSTGEPYRFTGQRFDTETGLYYYRARYYTAKIGRFLQTDPVGYAADMNLYTYVGNDPVNLLDPTGELVLFSQLGAGGYWYAGGEISYGRALDVDALMTGKIRVFNYLTGGGGVGFSAGATAGSGVFGGSITDFHGGFLNGSYSFREPTGVTVSYGYSCGISNCNLNPQNQYVAVSASAGTPIGISGSWTNTWFLGAPEVTNIDLSAFIGTADALQSTLSAVRGSAPAPLKKRIDRALAGVTAARAAIAQMKAIQNEGTGARVLQTPTTRQCARSGISCGGGGVDIWGQ
ncbi:MAG: RHS repeat-associated core domain-containing protein [Alphaproteobacteria bacterium]|nr:RHS repeat-associated core domain-containing protein [Alphaproteobacteria bacterium]MBV9061992.1 RHS repeat-associated core domain-containing protein [Alphaproteobacteria bacterium]